MAIAARPMFVWARAAGSLYQAELQRLLSLRLGVEWQPDRSNTREIAGFDRDTLRTFSKRTVEIEAELEASGATYESPALRMRADDEASLATRPAKDHAATPAMLFGSLADRSDRDRPGRRAPSWSGRCAGVTPNSVPVEFGEVARRLIDEDTGVCAHDARFAEHDVIEHIAGLAAGRLSPDEITGLARPVPRLRSRRPPRLRRRPPGGNRPAGRPSAHRALEDDTLRLLDGLAARPGASIAATTIADRLRAVGFLGADQCQAVSTLCGPGGSVRAVLAPAGYGKTAMAHAAAGCASADGRPVLAVATTAKAVAELRSAGLPARTIAQFRIDLTSGDAPGWDGGHPRRDLPNLDP